MSIPSPTFTAVELAAAKKLTKGISGPSPEARFVQYCVDYYATWYEHSKARIESNAIPHDQAALFLFSQVPEVSPGLPNIDPASLKRTHTIALSIEKGIFICNETMKTSFSVPLDLASSDEIMDFALSELRDEQTFVIVLMAKRLLLVHLAGVPLSEWYNDPMKVSFNGGVNEVDLASVDEQLSNYHEEHTSTPLAYTARLMWYAKENGRPSLHHKPELHVQTTLLTHLKAWFRHADVLVQEEIGNPGGRVDIQISRASGGKITRSTLELKILKPDESDNWNLDWGKKGIQQAKDYINHESDFSMACLFDARLEKKDPLADLEPCAKGSGVELRRYDMQAPAWTKAKRKPSAKKAATAKTNKNKSVVASNP